MKGLLITPEALVLCSLRSVVIPSEGVAQEGPVGLSELALDWLLQLPPSLGLQFLRATLLHLLVVYTLSRRFISLSRPGVIQGLWALDRLVKSCGVYST